MPALTLAIAGTAIALATGSDVPRYLFLVSPFVMTLVLVHASVLPRLDLELALALCASIVIWVPLAAFPDPVLADHFFSDVFFPGEPMHNLATGVSQAAPFLLVWLLLVVGTIAFRLVRNSRAGAASLD